MLLLVGCLAAGFHLPFTRRRDSVRISDTKWSISTSNEVSSKLLSTTNVTLPDDVTYYLAEANAEPIAFLISRRFSLYGEPIVDICCLNGPLLKQSNINKHIWKAFAREFGQVPLFHTDTIFYKTPKANLLTKSPP